MSRYIDVEALGIGKANPDVCDAHAWNAAIELIEAAPIDDVAEVRHGRNVTDMHPVDEFICSKCGLILRDLTETRIDEENEDECYFEFECKYCPNRGARMDGDEE